jgi:hypothetical protein
MNASNGFIALHRSEEARSLQERHPKAFLLLTQIALRARYAPEPDGITGLRHGQALIGDFRAAGISTTGEYRHAKKVLFAAGLATFETTNKGTVATLIGSSIFSITRPPSNTPDNTQDDNPATHKQHASNTPATTKNKVTRKEGNTPSVGTPAIAWSPTGGWSGISDQDRAGWAEAYPACDIDRQLAAAHQWLRSNPTKAKKKQWRRFITNWLSRSQERGGDAASSRPATPGRKLSNPKGF